MKKQILTALTILVLAPMTFAAPIVIGDATFKDELVILNKNIVCNAYSAPAENVKPETLVYGTYTVAMSREGSILVQGDIDGDLFSIQGNPNESLNISLQQSTNGTGGKAPAYSFSSSGSFTNHVIHGKQVKVASLSVLLNGKTKHVGCSLQ